MNIEYKEIAGQIITKIRNLGNQPVSIKWIIGAAWALVLIPIHLAAAFLLSFFTCYYYSIYWLHADVHMQPPDWAAILFFVPAFASFGFVTAGWNRVSGLLSGVPVLVSYFFLLGLPTDCRYTEYIPEYTLWDAIGRPTLAATIVGVVSAMSASFGWAAGLRTLKRLGRALREFRDERRG